MKLFLSLLLVTQLAVAQTTCGNDPNRQKQAAEAELKRAEEDGKVAKALSASSGIGNAATIGGVAVALTTGFVFLRAVGPATRKCTAPSVYSMVAGGIALFVGNLLANRQHKSRLKKIQQDWDALMAKGTAGTEGQSQAFEFLARREDSMEKAASMKATVYGLGAVAFGASAVLATMETIQVANPKLICPAPVPTPPPPPPALPDEIVVTGNTSPFAKFLLKPLTRAIFSGIMAGLSGTMALHAKKVAKNAKERAAFLRKMKDEFNTGGSAAIATAAPGASAGSAETGAGAATVSGSGVTAGARSISDEDGFGKACVSDSGVVDQACKCKATASCLKSPPFDLPGVDPTTLTALQGSFAPIDQMGDGTFGNATIDASAAVAKAARLVGAARKLAATSKVGTQIEKERPQVAGAVSGFLAANGNGLMPAGLDLQPLPKNVSEAAAQLEKELPSKESTPTVVSTPDTGTLIDPVGSAGVEDVAFNEGKAVDEMMKKDDFDFENDDVHKKSDDSIFKVLSNRYQSSGRRRLLTE